MFRCGVSLSLHQGHEETHPGKVFPLTCAHQLQKLTLFTVYLALQVHWKKERKMYECLSCSTSPAPHQDSKPDVEPQAPAKPISGMVPIWSRRFAPEPQAEAAGSEDFPSPGEAQRGASRALPLNLAAVSKISWLVSESLSTLLCSSGETGSGIGALAASQLRGTTGRGALSPAISQGQEGNKAIPAATEPRGAVSQLSAQEPHL